MGQVAVLRELLVAAIAASDRAEAVVSLAIANGTKVREHAVSTEIPDGWIAGADLELGNLQRLLAQLKERDSG